ncbi:hypothetical protein SRABI26_00392 [Arthrobacter sp. Bi26]|uniref:hypothetical protein n=1 Tax=Arthrobacter sp. Bi26 TaxID=2822350 RepID=UPI001D2E93F7|nr:hypothetical protein [Arthrobacter sp. Bi26]CAH0137562.1 hypothetical protein SRABI26_00392 [Arthrobacter sp. Bi26]
MSDDLPAEAIREAIYSKRFLAADRAKLDLAEIGSWDEYLLREHRLLVPVDVQALYVPPGSTEPMVRLPMLVSHDSAGNPFTPQTAMPEPFTPGTPRAPGVHLHWAMPDALLRGRLDAQENGQQKLAMPILPDRWAVLRLIHPVRGSQPLLTGWVLLADQAVAVPLADYREDMAVPDSARAGEPIGSDALTGTVGGNVNWSGVYDAVLNRFAFHDPLEKLDELAPNGVDGDCATYVVAGWWRDPAQDPLDPARSSDSLHELLDRLRWRLMYEWGDETAEQAKRKSEQDLRQALGLQDNGRWDDRRPPVPVKTAPDPQAQRPASFQSAAAILRGEIVQEAGAPHSSAFASAAVGRFHPAIPWGLRSSLLHGSVFGVPVSGPVLVDHRPDSTALAVALGEHDDDVVAAFAAAGKPESQRRDTERLLAAFTAQKVGRLAAPDGIVEIEEHEHAAGFSALPGGISGTDRYLQRRQTGGVGGLTVGKSRSTVSRREAGVVEADLTISFHDKPRLVAASELTVYDLARSRVGDVLTATEERVVNRPAAMFSFPDDPLVAVRGLRRSLRHGGDGRGSADGKLTCRWPTHAITEIGGLIEPGRFIRSLGNGSLPLETLTLAREAMLLDPYHDEWTARAVAPSRLQLPFIRRRLLAESALRFGPAASYDGATVAFHPSMPRTAAARRQRAMAPAPLEVGVRQQQTMVADELHRFSLYAGADPDLVGVTAWCQPWIPLWLEWEVKIVGLDPATVESWRLGQLDLEPTTSVTAAATEGESVVLQGRSVLTTGGASTLHSAINDWLKSEDAQGSSGDASPVTEDALRMLAAAVQHLDLASAALAGVRHQLLGFAALDGLVSPAGNDGTVGQPVPESAPRSLLAGVVRLTAARLLDAYGRTLDVPVDTVQVPTRLAVPDEPGLLEVPPRLLRPARWQFRLVDSATPTGAEGVEARVDEIEPDLQVSPVAGFLLPDHLDESLEVFAADGSPLGELLHEPVSGGVLWEIAPGRLGPANSGPAYGLSPAQLPLAWFASGLVAADAAGRAGSAPESSLSALLRAVDTTLWNVDSLASLGTEHVAGLVGRPVAVVRTQLRLELQPPTDVDLSNPARAAEWSEAEAAAARYAFSVRIGEVTRTDDGVLGFFVDDDYSRFRLVDKAIAAAAADAGRNRGQLGLYGSATGLPGRDPLTHPYIAGTDEADTLQLHLGQTVTLTLLMHPSGKANLTSGILPRRMLALARNWVGPGLAAIAPSLRTGPVLVETDLDPDAEIRLPKVSVFGKDQNFLWRDTPGTWRTDAILAATQTALLPGTPAEFREGWIRVAPKSPEPGEGGQQ